MSVEDVGNGILAGLTKVANLFVNAMQDKISQNGLPKAISEAISIDPAKQEGNSASITVKIDLETAPMAAAFEWGSGIHSQLQPKETYEIAPRNVSMLAIPRERWSNYQPPPDVDPVILRKVNHPGVAARPYLVPSITENKEEFKKILGREFKAAILMGVPRVTRIEVEL